MIAALLAIVQVTSSAAPAPQESVAVDTRLRVDMHRTFRSLPNYAWKCDLGFRGILRLDVSGPTVAHGRPALLKSEGKMRLRGLADNNYAPGAITIGPRTSVNESFRIEQGGATFYLLLTWYIDHSIGPGTLDLDVPISAGQMIIRRRTQDMAMAKPFAEGNCKMIGDAGRG